MNNKIWEEIIQIRKGLKPEAVLALVVRATKGSPRNTGAKMLVNEQKDIIGTIGGGAVENLVVKHAVSMITNRIDTEFVSFALNSSSDTMQATGMVCGGEMDIYFERIYAPSRLIIFGCGHIGTDLAHFAEKCGFRITVIDDRKEFASSERFSERTEVICESHGRVAEKILINPTDYIVVLTHQHQHDKEVLLNLLKREDVSPGYIGMIGSSSKVAHTKEYLLKNKVSKNRIDKIFAPIGLDIGAETPAELAVAILSEILAVKNKKTEDGYVKLSRSK